MITSSSRENENKRYLRVISANASFATKEE